MEPVKVKEHGARLAEQPAQAASHSVLLAMPSRVTLPDGDAGSVAIRGGGAYAHSYSTRACMHGMG